MWAKTKKIKNLPKDDITFEEIINKLKDDPKYIKQKIENMPIVEILRIQEALKPLGYAISGFSMSGDITVNLKPFYFPVVRRSMVNSLIKEVFGLDNLDDISHGE